MKPKWKDAKKERPEAGQTIVCEDKNKRLYAGYVQGHYYDRHLCVYVDTSEERCKPDIFEMDEITRWFGIEFQAL